MQHSSDSQSVGFVRKANFDMMRIYPSAGDFSVDYIYVTKDVALSGTIKQAIFGATDTQAVEITTHYDLNYRRGWNKEVTLYTTEQDFKDSTTTVYSREYWYSGYEPYEVKWFYYSP